MHYDDLAQRCKVLGHPDRIRLLDLLAQPERFPGNQVDARRVGICVNDLATEAGMPQSTTSGHITQLRLAGLVQVERRGQWRYVRASSKELGQLASTVRVLGSRPVSA
jgi:ArsR family transcriptional regulator